MRSFGSRRRGIGWGGLFVWPPVRIFISLFVGVCAKAEGFADVARGGAERVSGVAIAFVERVAGGVVGD